MRFEVTRRDVMKFAGGAAVGVALSPAPWKLLDDLSIWTQNGSWIPRLPRGPVTERATVCALCPAACPIRARCVAGIPVQLAAASDAPLCPLGLTGHHLAYHPARLTAPARVRQGDAGRLVIDRLPLPLAIDEIVGAVDAAREAGVAVAVLDTRPG
ncbi:MAG TPA: twin-arginine translocation signal domain-containing protein, partial [Gammaproteobacteria bacterium]|nr:twin-arginine translocation signal domain-containing protein [Gammaproteobacteria bacterium]